MSKYTTEVRYICEFYAGLSESKGYNDIETIIEAAAPKIFDFDFPMYEGETHFHLERKILMHYYLREIGMETAALWKYHLKVRLQEIMPYYVDLWKHRLNDIVPSGNIDYYEAFREDTAGESNSTGTKTGKDTESETGSSTKTYNENETIEKTEQDTKTGATVNTYEGDTTRTPNLTTKDKYSDTPQGGLTGVDSDTYLTNYRRIDNTGTETVTDDRTETETYDDITNTGQGNEERIKTGSDTDRSQRDKTANSSENTTGHDTQTGQRESLMHRYGITSWREYVEIKEKLLALIINIDTEIINQLSDLFFGLY